eukprot:TRINITY_DN8443_c0_g1_i1.p1 TRINITY_DN8443_c0_g1~~TRINITY_DN8443_c0_g1_i1.p1  ORF type:complete len:721 (+),score=128.62 TRINITY_DN8443_c0_g1_i1:344-2506(+)
MSSADTAFSQPPGPAAPFGVPGVNVPLSLPVDTSSGAARRRRLEGRRAKVAKDLFVQLKAAAAANGCEIGGDRAMANVNGAVAPNGSPDGFPFPSTLVVSPRPNGRIRKKSSRFRAAGTTANGDASSDSNGGSAEEFEFESSDSSDEDECVSGSESGTGDTDMDDATAAATAAEADAVSGIRRLSIPDSSDPVSTSAVPLPSLGDVPASKPMFVSLGFQPDIPVAPPTPKPLVSTCASPALPDGAAFDICPAHGVLSICGRRREMEDAVALIPGFVTVPCKSILGCGAVGEKTDCGPAVSEEESKTVASEETGKAAGSEKSSKNAGVDPVCQLHLFGVYDGHGGSQAAMYLAERLHASVATELQRSMANGVAPVAAAAEKPASESKVEASKPAADNLAAEAPSGATADTAPDVAPEVASADVASDVAAESPPFDPMRAHWKTALTAAFLRMDAEISGLCYRSVPGGPCERPNSHGGPCHHEPIAVETVGSTSVVAVVGAKSIIVANAGDSRAVLSRGGKAVPLSIDHKPEREDEMKRVEAAGGRVIFWNGFRVLGVLAMSRAIGDRYLKPYVISEPELTFTDRTDEDECIIMASDGLWDVVTSEVACEVARRCLADGSANRTGGNGIGPHLGRSTSNVADMPPMPAISAETGGEDVGMDGPPAAVAANVLAKLALARGSGDNISVVVVDLKRRHEQKPNQRRRQEQQQQEVQRALMAPMR